MRKLAIFFLALGLIFMAFIIGSDTYDSQFVYSLYLLIGVACFGQGYMEFANIIKLGFGVTRKKIYIHFTFNLVLMLAILFGVTIVYNLLFGLVKGVRVLDLFNLKMLLFLSLLIPFFGELGMFFANININRKIGSLIFIFIIIIIGLEIFVFERKLLINLLLFILIFVFAILNYIFIYNIKIKRS